MLKLHLGCGEKILEGFVNVDIRALPGVNLVSDIKTLREFANDTVDLIYVCHVLEHFTRREYKNVLKRWYDLLKHEGVLRIAVPNFESICKYYNKTKDLNSIRGLLYGGQNYEQNFHFCGWDFETLKEDLHSIGFKEVDMYDYKLTEHANIDDYSQAYLPHMDKENGLLMSLNIEARK